MAEPKLGANETPTKSKNKSRLNQTDVPSYSIEQALRIPRAIAENYAFKPTKPLDVAAALNLAPNSSSFRMLTGAAIAYGFTIGGAYAPEIAISPLGLKIVRPQEENEDVIAKKEAVLHPRIFKEFLEKYDGSPLPKTEIAKNVLISMGVPTDRVDTVLEMLLESAESVGFIRQIKEKRYIDLKGINNQVRSENNDFGTNLNSNPEPNNNYLENNSFGLNESIQSSNSKPPTDNFNISPLHSEDEVRRKRVFITHGKNKSFLDPIRKLLSFGELEPVVSIDRQSVSQPVPDKVMNDMRGCGAAIIHVDAEQKLIDQEANELIVLNPNVLIEIGAAMALYGRRFILLVKNGIQLPSNLQGLYEVRYSGEALDGEATIKLLEAIRDIKNHPTPLQYVSTHSDFNKKED